MSNEPSQPYVPAFNAGDSVVGNMDSILEQVRQAKIKDSPSADVPPEHFIDYLKDPVVQRAQRRKVAAAKRVKFDDIIVGQKNISDNSLKPTRFRR